MNAATAPGGAGANCNHHKIASDCYWYRTSRHSRSEFESEHFTEQQILAHGNTW
jgi:hypothetical protein